MTLQKKKNSEQPGLSEEFRRVSGRVTSRLIDIAEDLPDLESAKEWVKMMTVFTQMDYDGARRLYRKAVSGGEKISPGEFLLTAAIINRVGGAKALSELETESVDPGTWERLERLIGKDKDGETQC